jgi:hypothetical protein
LPAGFSNFCIFRNFRYRFVVHPKSETVK